MTEYLTTNYPTQLKVFVPINDHQSIRTYMVKTNGIFGVKCPKSLCLGGSIILPSYKKYGIGARRSIIPQLIKWIILLDMYQARKLSGHGYVLGVSLFPLSIGRWNCSEGVGYICFSNYYFNMFHVFGKTANCLE